MPQVMSSTLPTKSAWKVKVWSSQAKTRQRSFKHHLTAAQCSNMLVWILIVKCWKPLAGAHGYHRDGNKGHDDMRLHLHFANLQWRKSVINDPIRQKQLKKHQPSLGKNLHRACWGPSILYGRAVPSWVQVSSWRVQFSEHTWWLKKPATENLFCILITHQIMPQFSFSRFNVSPFLENPEESLKNSHSHKDTQSISDPGSRDRVFFCYFWRAQMIGISPETTQKW